MTQPDSLRDLIARAADSGHGSAMALGIRVDAILAALDAADPAQVEQACPTLYAELHVAAWDEGAQFALVDVGYEALKAERDALRTERDDLLDSNQTWSDVAARVCAATGADVLVRVPERYAALRAAVDRVEALCDEQDNDSVLAVYDVRAALGEV